MRPIVASITKYTVQHTSNRETKNTQSPTNSSHTTSQHDHATDREPNNHPSLGNTDTETMNQMDTMKYLNAWYQWKNQFKLIDW